MRCGTHSMVDDAPTLTMTDKYLDVEKGVRREERPSASYDTSLQ